MRSAVTICLVPEAARGPFVFHGPLAGGGLGAPAIIGSMQGRSGGDVSREAALCRP